jgi:hypothetical protein
VKYPTHQELLKQDSLQGDRLFELKRSLRSIFPRLLLFLLASIIVVLANVKSSFDPNIGERFSFFFRILGVIPLVICLDILRLHYNDLYIFSRYKLTRISGRISFSYNVPTINYSDIRAIVVEQGFFGRLLDYGNILLGTAAQDKHELILEGVVSPYELSKLIEEFRRSHQLMSVKGD